MVTIHKTTGAPMALLEDILIPKALLSAPEGFGGSPQGDCLRGNLVVRGNRAVGLEVSPPSTSPRMVIPALSEAHCHLDKCYSIERLGDVGGDLTHALTAMRRDKANWTATDIRNRMVKGLTEAQGTGCGQLRSHIDWGDEITAPLAWSVLDELTQDNPMQVQLAALTGIDQMADNDVCDGIAREVVRTANGVLGAFLLNHSKMHEGLHNIFAAAGRYGLPMDFHVDEGLGDSNGLELICDVALETGFEGPILCGHAVSLADKSGGDLDRIIDKLARAGIAICALPTTNLYLQGRRDGTPDRRGITRLRELEAGGVPVLIGSDNVADAFCPLGQHDPRAALHLAALAAHLDPPMGRWLPSITADASKAMGLDVCFIDAAPLERLRICDAASTADLVAGRAPLLELSNFLEVPSS